MPDEDAINLASAVTVDHDPGALTPSTTASRWPVAELIAGRYEILGLLGVGGMGSVYRVRDRELDEVVALKFLRHEMLGDPRMLARFREEVRLARRVTHLNVARTYDIGEHGDERFLTMEYVDGEALSRLVAREGALGVERAVEIARALCAGLAAAHDAGVVHRDLKPDNVLLGRAGRVVITDFGIARASAAAPVHTQGPVGTAAYMAPEQVESVADVDARADLYALGALVYELVTGELAWPGDSFARVALARLIAPPPDPRARNPRLPDGFADAVLKCMARRREERFASAADVAVALSASLDSADPLPPPIVEPAGSERSMQRVAPVPMAADPTVAVLAIRNGGSAEGAELAEDLTDELTDALCKMAGLRVRPRSLVARHEAADADPLAVGRAVGARVVVEASARRSGDGVRVSARLLNVADGFQVWAHRAQRPITEVLALTDEIALAIAGALTVEVERAAGRGPMAADATELYLKARKELRGTWHGLTDTAGAVAAFEAALAKAPMDPDVMAGYAMARARHLNYGGGRDATEPAATLAWAERAVALAGHQGEPWLALATVHYVTGDWPAAVRALRTALRRAPGLVKAHEMLGCVLLEAGRMDEAAYRFETVLSLDPGAYMARVDLARGWMLAGSWERADALLSFAGDLPQDSMSRLWARLRAALWRRSTDANLFVPAGLAAASPTVRLATLLIGVQRTGVFPEADKVAFEGAIAQTARGSRFRPLLLQLITEVHAFVGEDAAALAALERAFDAGLYDLLWFERCPLLEPLRASPAYARMLQGMRDRVDPVNAALDAPL